MYILCIPCTTYSRCYMEMLIVKEQIEELLLLTIHTYSGGEYATEAPNWTLLGSVRELLLSQTLPLL